MSFQKFVPHKVIQIDGLYTIHYFEYFSDFTFEGEVHDFWEFLCVDKGEVDVIAGTAKHYLRRGDIIFHQPNEFHNVQANGVTAPNLVVISFACNSPAMDFFCGKILTIGDEERALLGNIIGEAQKAFCSPLDDPYYNSLERSDSASFGSEQLIHLYMEQLLLLLYRKNTEKIPQSKTKTLKKRSDTYIYTHIIDYLEQNISVSLSVEQICKDNLIGRSQLQKLFREKNNCGVIDHFSHMKIESAKELIRENRLNFTQIAESLGYTSIHYFSRQFKKITGMTPSEYSSSIKCLSTPRKEKRAEIPACDDSCVNT